MTTNSFKQVIESEMRLKTTDELLVIWTENNRAEWTDDAFEVIREILAERLEQIPVQNNPSYERVDLFEQDIKNFLNSTGFISIGLPFVLPLIIFSTGYKILELVYGTKIPDVPMYLIMSLVLVFPILSGIMIIKRREMHDDARIVKGGVAVFNGIVMVLGCGIAEIAIWFLLIQSLLNFEQIP